MGFSTAERPELVGPGAVARRSRGRRVSGFLQLTDIYNLKLRADLVVLSACQTALGKDIRGEGLIGMTRAFMYAGTPRVIASLWEVPNRATTELMKRFYDHFLVDHLSPAAALACGSTGDPIDPTLVGAVLLGRLRAPGRAALASPSQRPQKVENRLPVRFRERVESRHHGVGFRRSVAGVVASDRRGGRPHIHRQATRAPRSPPAGSPYGRRAGRRGVDRRPTAASSGTCRRSPDPA